MDHASRIPSGEPWCTDQGSCHVLAVTKKHQLVHMVGLCQQRADNRVTTHFQMSFGPPSPYDGEGGTGLPAALGHEDRAALQCWLFLVKEQEAEPAVGCPPGVKKTQNPKGK